MIARGNRFQSQYIVATLMVFAIVIALLTFLISRLLAPLRQLIQKIRSGHYGAFHWSDSVELDDVQSIVEGFDEMMRENIELNDHLLKEQQTKYQLRYNMLKAQINPHFLFNTLNGIKWKAVINQDPDVADMLADLGVLLEASMSRDSELIRIDEEIELVKAYMAIQNNRFSNRYKLEINCPKELYKCRIIKLLLQPIVENAIVHGFANIDELALVKISVEKHDKDIWIHVSDNGNGMNSERVKEVMEGIKSTKDTFNRIGLANINQRLQYSYGREYGITIDSIQDQGTIVTVHMPDIEQTEEER